MNLPDHPPHADDEAVRARPRRRVVVAVICVVVFLASIHLLRTALG
jgi:hypothetical protein